MEELDLYVVAIKDNENGFLEQYKVEAKDESLAVYACVGYYVTEHIGSGHFEKCDLEEILNEISVMDYEDQCEYLLDWEFDVNFIII